MKRSVFAFVAVAGLAAAANAQVGTANVAYEVSDDGGATWNGGLTETVASSVLVRIRASWSDDAGMYAFAGAQFDVVVTGVGGAGAGDTVSNAIRPGTTSGGSAQTIVATRFGNQIKIDDVRDTLGPGAGTRGVFPGQLVENFAGTNFSNANPITIFQFELNLDGSIGDRDMSSLYIAPSGGNTIDRVMRIYTSPAGAQNTPSTTTRGATVRVVPAPGALALLGLGGLAIARRRR